MKIENQMNILRRLGELNGNAGEYKLHHDGPKVNYNGAGGYITPFDNIEGAIHHEINKLERNEIEPGTSRRIYLEGRER